MLCKKCKGCINNYNVCNKTTSSSVLYYQTFNYFPTSGSDNVIYIDLSSGEGYYWTFFGYKKIEGSTFQLNTEDSLSIDLSGNGTLSNKLKGDVIISGSAGNILQVRPDGLFAELGAVSIPTLQEVVNEGNTANIPIIFNSPIQRIGNLLTDSLTSLNLTNWTDFSTGTSFGVSGLSYTTGTPNYTNRFRLNKYFPYEKLLLEFEFTPSSIASGNVIGIGMSQEVSAFAGFLYFKFDCFTKRFSYGTTTSVNNGTSPALIGNILNERLKVSIRRVIDRTICTVEIISTGEKIFADFLIQGWGSQGRFTLAFLGGSGTVHSFNVSSEANDFGFNKGVLFVGDSYTVGGGASSFSSTRFPDVTMNGSREDYEVVGVNSVKSGELLPYLTESLVEIRPKYTVIMVGANDSNQAIPTGTYNTNLTALANAVISVGSIPIIIEVGPQNNSNVTAYNTEVANVTTALSLNKISIFNLLKNSGTGISSLYDADNVHVNDAGNLVIANAILQGDDRIFQEYVERLTTNEYSLQLNNLPVGEDSEDLLSIGVDNIVKRVRSQIDRRNIILAGGNIATSALQIGTRDNFTTNIITNKIVRLTVDFAGTTIYGYSSNSATTSTGFSNIGYTSGQGGATYINLCRTAAPFSGTVLYHMLTKNHFSFQTFDINGVQNWPIIMRMTEGNVIIGSYPGLGDPNLIAGNGAVTNAGIKPERYRLYVRSDKNSQPNLHSFLVENNGGDNEGVNSFIVRNSGNVIIGSETDLPLVRFKVDAIANTTIKGSMPFPRMTEAERLSMILDPSYAGLHVYQTNATEGVYVYKSTGWQFAY